MRLSVFIEEGISALQTLYPAEEARNIVLLLCCERLGTQRYTHIVEPSFEVPLSFYGILENDLERLVSGEPIQYVVGKTCFRGMDYKVDPRVLIPRPETEELVSLALANIKEGDRVLDICTGSGCIAWSLAFESKVSEVVGVDLSEDALAVAESQYSDDRVHFLRADVLMPPAPQVQGPFDIIISNPPYILDSERAAMRSNVLDFEPGMALFVPDSDPLLFYRAVADWAGILLGKGGLGFVEINERFGKETLKLFESAGFADIQVVKDIFGKNRFVSFRK